MDPSAIASAGPWVGLFGVLLSGLYAILSGKLVPSVTVDKLTAGLQGQVDDWKTAYQSEAARGDVQSAVLAELMTYAKTADRVLQSLPVRKD